MQDLLNELGSISPILPILVLLIIIAIACILTWVLISIPAYWLAQALDGPLGRVASVVDQARVRIMEMMRPLFSVRGSSIARFISGHSQLFSYVEDNQRLVHTLEAIHASVAAISSNWSRLETSVARGEVEVERAQLALGRVVWPERIEPPSPKEYALVQAERNDARLRVITFSVFGSVLVGINTLMLKEFFASFVPPLKIVDVPLPIVIACLFSVIEAAFGACFAFIEGASLTAYLKRALAAFAIISLACIEFGFYARFGAEFDFDPFVTLWTPNKPPSWTTSWFGIFGPFVVLGLAFCGEMLFSALRVLRRDAVVRQYRSFLGWRTRTADAIGSTTDSILKRPQAVNDLLNQIKSVISAEPRQVFDALQNLDEVVRQA